MAPDPAILDLTMDEYPHDDPFTPTRSQQEVAHDRGRICKKRGCVVCAPLVEQRRQKKKERREKTQARQHAQGQPCARGSCTIDVCVAARSVPVAPTSPVEQPPVAVRAADSSNDPERARRRQAERHRVDLPCGAEDCSIQICVDGFANERTRRHRAGRPCRSTSCDNAICVAGRAAT